MTPETAVLQASLSITSFQSLLKLMSIESVMPSNHVILCHPLLLLPSIFPSIRVFTVWCTNYTTWYSPNGGKNLCPHKNLSMDICSSFVYHCQNLEANKMFFSGWMNEWWHIQIMGCYLMLKINETASHEKTWRNLKCIFLTLLLLYWLCQSFWPCRSQQTVENSERDGNTRPPDLPLEKSVCRSRNPS